MLSALLGGRNELGQMLNDVRLAVAGQAPVEFYGRMGGIVPFPDEILSEIRRVAYEPLVQSADPRMSWMQRFVPGSN
jgi:2-oxoglutarate/2-oxoacid ferredoxin oxidoreductase subunit alpha